MFEGTDLVTFCRYQECMERLPFGQRRKLWDLFSNHLNSQYLPPILWSMSGRNSNEAVESGVAKQDQVQIKNFEYAVHLFVGFIDHQRCAVFL